MAARLGASPAKSPVDPSQPRSSNARDAVLLPGLRGTGRENGRTVSLGAGNPPNSSKVELSKNVLPCILHSARASSARALTSATMSRLGRRRADPILGPGARSAAFSAAPPLRDLPQHRTGSTDAVLFPPSSATAPGAPAASPLEALTPSLEERS